MPRVSMKKNSAVSNTAAQVLPVRKSLRVASSVTKIPAPIAVKQKTQPRVTGSKSKKKESNNK